MQPRTMWGPQSSQAFSAAVSFCTVEERISGLNCRSYRTRNHKHSEAQNLSTVVTEESKTASHCGVVAGKGGAGAGRTGSLRRRHEHRACGRQDLPTCPGCKL